MKLDLKTSSFTDSQILINKEIKDQLLIAKNRIDSISRIPNVTHLLYTKLD